MVLLASHTWSQDALRFGALVQGNQSKAEAILLNIILRDIGEIYGIPVYILRKMELKHDACQWDWYRNDFSAGTTQPITRSKER